MGVFEEDHDIWVEELTEFWVLEGLLKPISDKRLEEVASEYLKDLVDRNLILVEERNHNGEAEFCKIHDLLRDLCLRESQKDRFLVVTRQHSLNNSLQGINARRRVAIDGSTSGKENQYNFLQIRDALRSASLARTFICDTVKVLPAPSFRLLRVLGSSKNRVCPLVDEYSFSNHISQLVNLRSFVLGEIFVKSRLPSSIYLFWNLQRLVLKFKSRIKSFDVWKMPLLRFVYIYRDSSLMNPGQDDFVLGDLHTLQYVRNFRCSEKVAKRIPNIKVLRVSYDEEFIGSRYCQNNLAHLHKLEQLGCFFEGEIPSRGELVQNLTFPHSLKKLTLSGGGLHSEDISTKIGSLPHLQVLELFDKSILGPEWETIEGQFCSLKILEILCCSDLKCWKTDDTHFPCLEQLILEDLDELEEIPSAIGNLSTLRLIALRSCPNSVLISAKEIAKEQEELENQDLHVKVFGIVEQDEFVQSLAGPNFEVLFRETIDDSSG